MLLELSMQIRMMTLGCCNYITVSPNFSVDIILQTMMIISIHAMPQLCMALYRQFRTPIPWIGIGNNLISHNTADQ